jgi:PAS domain S-box-containing protein
VVVLPADEVVAAAGCPSREAIEDGWAVTARDEVSGSLVRELAAIVASSDDAILSKRLDGTIRSWNAAAERLFGYTSEEAIGQPMTIITPDDRREEVADILGRIAAGESVDHFETTRRHKNGTLVAVSVTVSPIRDDLGRVVAASVIAHDVGPARAAEARRSASLDVALDAVVTMTADGEIVEFNPAAERVFGYATEQAIGRMVAETLVPPDQRDAHRRGLARYLESGRGPLIGRRVDIIAMRADGTEFPAEIAISPFELDGATLFTAHIRDMSERYEADRKLKEGNERRRDILASLLQAEEQERSRIATELHDDTVQVMTASLIALDRVAKNARKTGIHQQLESAIISARTTLEEATERTRRLMFELRPAILHQQGLGAAIKALVTQVARETGSQATVAAAVGRFDHFTEELVYRSSQEVLANVRKHAEPHQITVSLKMESEIILVDVTDDGRGFDEPQVNSRPGAALHLGLDTLRERVQAAGGTVEIESTAGSGTHVRLIVPSQPPGTQHRHRQT